MPKAVVFGAHGGIGTATTDHLLAAGYTVVPVSRLLVDFAQDNSYNAVSELLTNHQPDVVVNCAGHFDNTNTEPHHMTFDINVGSNWAVIQHYMNNASKKPVHVIIVGSSAYSSGRKNYMLYSASKAAVYNLWQGACEYFLHSTVCVSLINPVRTRTAMIGTNIAGPCLEPTDVAEEILNIASTTKNQMVDMNYSKEK
jgi:short-subunit dehydrogenase